MTLQGRIFAVIQNMLHIQEPTFNWVVKIVCIMTKKLIVNTLNKRNVVSIYLVTKPITNDCFKPFLYVYDDSFSVLVVV